MTKQITTESGIVLLLVEVPDGASDLTRPKVGIVDLYFDMKDGEYESVVIPQGNWKGKHFKEMSEEECAGLVRQYGGKIFDYDPKYYSSYPDYEFTNHPFESKFFDTAIESGHSLLKSQGILLVNPHEHPIYKGTMEEELFIHLESEYDEAQSKVKNPLVIKAEKI